MSFIAKIMEKEGGDTHLISAAENGKSCWHVLRIDPLRYKEYQKQLGRDNVDLTALGEVLESGWGEVTSELKSQLIEKYNMIA